MVRIVLLLRSIALAFIAAAALTSSSRAYADPILWVAANPVNSTLSYFAIKGITARIDKIEVGMSLTSTTTLIVRTRPSRASRPQMRINSNQQVRVLGLEKARQPSSSKRRWLNVELLSDDAKPVPPGSDKQSEVSMYDRPIFYDKYGLIVHHNDDGSDDGGDTAQREGWYWLGVWIRQHTPGLTPWKAKRTLTFDQVLKLLEPNGDGVFYRHPKQAPFNDPWSKEWGTSRDQLIPLIAAMGAWDRTAPLKRLWEALPVDPLGKHAFNGNWRNFLGQDGWNCTDVKKRSCGPTMDCSLRVDARDCPLATDSRDCSLQTDNRECSQPHDERGCHHWWGNDPICEVAKAAQNGIYAQNKLICESAKASQNAIYAGAKGTCEASKTTQNGLYAAQKAQCESSKSGTNLWYMQNKGLCEAAKTGGKYACEVYKQASYQLCRTTNVFSGDIIGPDIVNLYLRSLRRNPLLPNIDILEDPSIISVSSALTAGQTGETELAINVAGRVQPTFRNRDDTGPELNILVALVMSQICWPSPISQGAVALYATQRIPSYGSYLEAYRAQYGDDVNDITLRMDAGIAQGWKPDVSVSYGAARWYHRPRPNNVGANPALADLWGPILDYYVRPDVGPIRPQALLCLN